MVQCTSVSFKLCQMWVYHVYLMQYFTVFMICLCSYYWFEVGGADSGGCHAPIKSENLTKVVWKYAFAAVKTHTANQILKLHPEFFFF